MICIDVQPEYSGMNDGDESPVFPEIINFVNKQTGPVLMFVNAERDGLTGDTVQGIKTYWEQTIAESKNIDFSSEDFDGTNLINWNRYKIVDKGYGWFRSFMDYGIEPRIIIGLIRLMYQQKISDSRDIVWSRFGDRTSLMVEMKHAVEELDGDMLLINWTSVSQLKKFSGSYMVGGGRNECLKEVELLCNAFNINYTRIDSLVY